ncbi:uncharacterized protein V1516DRAFT_224897 [Lipomyces oligophaga]|uniref:uncharacterized protein n=1 Tax=Lipomyces oligophaga TaxID=45792 RepID=UPI0034CD21A2
MPPPRFVDHKVRTVSRRACLSCRERKIKCEGVQDCRNCRTLSVPCVFVPSHRGGKRRRKNAPPESEPITTSSNSAAAEIPSSLPAQSTLSAPSSVQSTNSASNSDLLEPPAKRLAATIRDLNGLYQDPSSSSAPVSVVQTPSAPLPVSLAPSPLSNGASQESTAGPGSLPPQFHAPLLRYTSDPLPVHQPQQHVPPPPPPVVTPIPPPSAPALTQPSRPVSAPFAPAPVNPLLAPPSSLGPPQLPTQSGLMPTAPSFFLSGPTQAVPLVQPPPSAPPVQADPTSLIPHSLPTISPLQQLPLDPSIPSVPSAMLTSQQPSIPPPPQHSPQLTDSPNSSLSAILGSIDRRLNSLQEQIDEIRLSQRTAAMAAVASAASAAAATGLPAIKDTESVASTNADSERSLNRSTTSSSLMASTDISMFRISEEQLRSRQLPSLRIVVFLIDVYYDSFHPEYMFMLPKRKFLESLDFEADAAVLQAMFAISCRLVAPETLLSVAASTNMRDAGTSPTSLTEPMYWINCAEKWIAMISHPIKKLKIFLLLAFSAIYDGNRHHARELLTFASSIVETHRLDLIDVETDSQGHYLHARMSASSAPLPTAKDHAELLPSFLDRECFRRIYYMIWEQQIITATVWSTPQAIPKNFSGLVHVPCCEVVYNEGKCEWHDKSTGFHEFANALYMSDSSSTGFSSRHPQMIGKRKWFFNSACFRLASLHILADTVVRLHDMTDEFVEESTRKVHLLLERIDMYIVGSGQIHMNLFFTHAIIWTTLILLHRFRARERLVFVVLPTPYECLASYAENPVTYTENPIARVRATDASPESTRSFDELANAACAILDMLRSLVESGGGREDNATWKMGPFMAFSLGLCIPIIASKIVLDGVQLPSIKSILGDLANTAASLSNLPPQGPFPTAPDNSSGTTASSTAIKSTTSPKGSIRNLPRNSSVVMCSHSGRTPVVKPDASPSALNPVSNSESLMASSPSSSVNTLTGLSTSNSSNKGKDLSKSDLDFCLRCMKLLGRAWRGMWHEYEGSVALVGRMEKVM